MITSIKARLGYAVALALFSLGSSVQAQLPSALDAEAIPSLVSTSAPTTLPMRLKAGADWRANWIEAVQWGGRMGYIDSDGRLQVTLRYDTRTPWVTLAEDVQDFQLLDWRVAVLKTDGSLWIAQGELNAPLRKIDTDVAAFQLTLTRTGILRRDGTFRIYEWGFEPYTVAENVRAFQTTFDRKTAIVDQAGALWVHEGGVVSGESFQKVADHVEAFQLERDWVAYTEDGHLMVAKGSLEHPLKFARVADGVTDFEGEVSVTFGGDFDSELHLAAVNAGGQLAFTQGAQPAQLKSALKSQGGSPVRSVQWAGGGLAVTGRDGSVQLTRRTSDGLDEFKALPAADGFCFNAEGAVLQRVGTKLMQTEPLRPRDTATRPLREGESLTAVPLKSMEGGELPKAAPLNVDESTALVNENGIGPMALSSMRPAHTRRPVSLPASVGKQMGALVFAANIDLRSEDNGGLRLESIAAGPERAGAQ